MSASQQEVTKALELLGKEIKANLSQPLYLKVTTRPGRGVDIEQVRLLTMEEFAVLAHVETRTVRLWMENAKENGLKFYRPPGTRSYLFDLNESLEWLKGDCIG